MRKYLVKVGTLLTMVLAFTFLFVGIFSSSNRVYAAWSGNGDGTVDNPYQIGTKAELRKFRDIVNGANGETQNANACAKLTADIDIESEEWVPIGTKSKAYEGVFDGNGKKISHLSITATNTEISGLFGLLGAATIKNVSVYGTVTAKNDAGGIAGKTSSDKHATFINCTNYVTVYSQRRAGGIVGQAYDAGITECKNFGMVVNNENNIGDISAGGIVGRVSAPGTVDISKCFNEGDISAINYCGGIIGETASSSGNVVPFNTNQITNCYNIGNVTASKYVGGIAGYNKGIITNCFNYGTVVFKTSSTTTYRGCIYGQNNSGIVTGCYYLTGRLYYIGTLSDDAEGGIVEGNHLTSDEFKLQANFENWNFTDVWMMGTNYPVFIPEHNHELTYEANGATITATCSAEDCPLENNQATLTLVAPKNLIYDGNPKEATFEAGYDASAFPNAQIKYYKDDQEVPSCVDKGTYGAQVTFGNVCAQIEFTITPHTHNDVEFTAWTSTTSLPTTAGNYYLTNNVTISSTWTAPSGTTRLCLNGHGIIKTGSGRVINVGSGSTLNVYDCDNETTHKYTVSSPTSYGAGLATVNDNASGVEDVDYFTFTGGYITGGSDSNGAGVQVYSTNSTAIFNLYGGTIIGNNGSGNGGAIWAKGGTFSMYGGALLHNKANQGAGVFAPNETPFAQINLLGGRIEGNIANVHGGALYGGTAVPLTLGNIRVTQNGSLGADAIGGITAAFATTNAHLYIKDSPYVYGNYNASGPSNLQGARDANNLQVIGSLGEDCRISFVSAAGVYDYYKSGFTHTDIDPNTLFSYDDGNYGLVKQGNHAVKVQLVSLSYNANGGTGNAPETVKYIPGDTIEVLDNPFTNGELIFNGWNTSADGTGTKYKKDDTFAISANTILYAQWTDFIALDPNDKTSVNIPPHTPLFGGDEIEVDTDATEVSVEWFYDDDEDGLPDDPANPIGEGEIYTVKTPDPNDPTHDDTGHKIIAKVTQNKQEDGTDYPEGQKPVQYSNPIQIYIPLDTNPEHKPDIEVPGDKDEVEDGDEISVDVDQKPVVIKWYYDDDNDGQPDDPANPIGTGETYEVKCPDETNEKHNDKGHTIIGVITQDKKPDGTDYPEGEAPTISTKPVKVEGELPKEIEVQVGKFYLFGDTIVFPEDAAVAANPEESITQKAGKVLVTYNIRYGAMVQFYDILTDTNGIIHSLYVDPISPITSASEIVGLKCESGDGTSANPYVFMAVTENDLYTPLDPTQKAELDKPTHTPLLDGDEITVETDANPVTVEWFYDDDHDGLPDDPANPIGEGMTYTVKTPDQDDPTHDDRGHTIVARVTQDKKEDGTEYPEGEKPVTYSDPVEVYTTFTPNPENPTTINVPGSKPKAENGDQIYVDVDGDPVTVKWYYDDDHDGQPDDPANPIGEGKEYIVVCPDSEDPTHDDTGHTIIAVIAQEKKPDGTDYPEGEAPTETTNPVVVKGNIGGFTPINPSNKPVIVIPDDKEEASAGDVLTVETETKPVIVTWYYDDNNDGRPDFATPIGTGKTYTVVCPDPQDSTHDDTGHKIIAIIKQTKDENGDDIPPSHIVQVTSSGIKVEGEIPHTHNFTYKVNGTTITAKCNNQYCPITEGLTLTLVAPTGNMVYDGQPRVATLKAGYSEVAFPDARIRYFLDSAEVTSCVNAGTYVASVTIATATVQVTFTIENWKEKDTAHNEVEAEIVGVAKDENIHIKVEVKTSISAQESQTEYATIKAKLESNEEILKVYDVKLIRTVNGVSTEIQPADIKEGTTIIVTMDIPENLVGKDFRILHVHGPNDSEFVENVTILGKKASFTVSRLSEFAFVAKKVNNNHGFCMGWVLFILMILEVLFLAFCSIPQILRKFGLEHKKEMFQNIGLLVSLVVLVFGVFVIIFDSCAIGITSYLITVVIDVCYIVYSFLEMRKRKAQQ